MNFLPIVQRELHVAARRVATYRLRVLVAAGAGAAAILPMLFSPVSPSMAGGFLFGVLTWGAFVFCLFEGLRVASDALAEEKREGTLGLLFLTDLRGYDVVLGKFASAAVRSFTALLASLPIFALPLLMGGMTAGEFWRVMLALLATLLVALTAGLCVSAIARSGLTAMGGTALALGALVFGAMAVDAWFGQGAPFGSGPWGAVRLAFEARFGYQPSSYWLAVLGCGLLSAGLLIAASVLLTKCWHDLGPSNRETWWNRLLRPRAGASPFGGGETSTNDPAVWLGNRLLPSRRVMWFAVGGAALICFLGGLFGSGIGNGTVAAVMVSFGLLVKVWMAALAPQALNEARRSGALEILLSTPLRPGAIVRGHIDAFIGFFLGPTAASILVFVVSGIAGAAAAGNSGGVGEIIGVAAAAWVIYFIFFSLDMYALAYVGLWFGLTEPRPGIAAAKTAIYVLVLPWVTMVVPFFGCLGILIWPIFWIIWASRRLDRRFRDEVGRQFAAEGSRSGWWPF